MSPTAKDLVEINENVAKLAEMLAVAGALVELFDDGTPEGAAFDSMCTRWIRWRREHRAPGEDLRAGADTYLAPHVMHLDLTKSSSSVRKVPATFTFSHTPEYDGDSAETIEVPVAFFVDPEAWETWAMTEGGYRTVASLRKEEQREAKRQKKARADEEFARAERLILSRGFVVKPRSVEADEEEES